MFIYLAFIISEMWNKTILKIVYKGIYACVVIKVYNQ